MGGGNQMEELLTQLMNEMREFRSDVNKRFENVSLQLENIENDVKGLKEEVQYLKEGQQRLEEAVARIESSQPHDIMAMLKSIDRKLDDKDFELSVLNKRVFKTEVDIERLSKQ
jgi:predicted  nucleic acid-binding Zn-ribbon protein